MSRSRRKTPVCGITTAKSEKWNKRFWARSLRVLTRIALGREDEVMPDTKEHPTRWGEKDGRQRFDPKTSPEGMRK